MTHRLEPEEWESLVFCNQPSLTVCSFAPKCPPKNPPKSPWTPVCPGTRVFFVVVILSHWYKDNFLGEFDIFFFFSH